MRYLWVVGLALLVACGAPDANRPAMVGAGYHHDLVRTGPCSDCDEKDLTLGGGYGLELNGLLRERSMATPRFSVSASYLEIESPFRATQSAVHHTGRMEWMFATSSDSDSSLAFRFGPGFGYDVVIAGDWSQSWGADLHVTLELDYRVAPSWSVVFDASPELVLLVGDGLSSDQTGMFGIPMFLGVRRALE